MGETETRAAALAAAVPPLTGPSSHPEPFASRMAGREERALGDPFGLRNFGVGLTLLPPGTVSALLHAHSRRDEFVYVLQGNPTLVTDGAEQVLMPGMCAGFRAGGARTTSRAAPISTSS
jgi:uncharacterized cupin superfamily protein